MNLRAGARVWVQFPCGAACYATRIVQVNRCNVWVENGASPPLAVLPEWCESLEIVRATDGLR